MCCLFSEYRCRSDMVVFPRELAYRHRRRGARKGAHARFLICIFMHSFTIIFLYFLTVRFYNKYIIYFSCCVVAAVRC